MSGPPSPRSSKNVIPPPPPRDASIFTPNTPYCLYFCPFCLYYTIFDLHPFFLSHFQLFLITLSTPTPAHTWGEGGGGIFQYIQHCCWTSESAPWLESMRLRSHSLFLISCCSFLTSAACLANSMLVKGRNSWKKVYNLRQCKKLSNR
jgi:hypothetical protein